MDEPLSLLGLNVTSASELLPIEDLDLDRCQLLGPVALIVQGVMGLIIVGGLVIKRMRERPRRKWKIWLADVGKQVVGQFAVHLSNVAISDLIASTRSDNPCSLFALNILIDTTLGVLLIYFLLQYSTTLMQRYQPHYKTGYYGNPFSFSLWAEQAAVYVACLAVMKIVVLIIFWVAPELEDGMSWGLSWIENEEAQVVVVMLILPLVMNLFQFLIVDSIIRSKDPASPGVISQNSDEESRRGFLESASDDEDEDGSTELRQTSRRGSARTNADGVEEYSDEDESGKQKEAAELLFDADSPTIRQIPSVRHETSHSYPPHPQPHSHSNSASSTLPPYSALPPTGPVSTPRQPPRNHLDQSDDETKEQVQEDDDGWGENWSASSDVEEERLKPIPLQQKPPIASTVTESHPSVSQRKESLPISLDSPPLPSTTTPTSYPSPPTDHLATPLEPMSSSSRLEEAEVDEDDNDWGFDDSTSSPTIQPTIASPSLSPLVVPPERLPPSINVVTPTTDNHEQTEEQEQEQAGLEVEENEDENEWGFDDDSLSTPASPIPPPLPDTSQAVEKALGVDEQRLNDQQSTVKAPIEVGKELDGLS
ncbi:hypothetical protein JCM5350_003610 [Sporobolomyces pararoseus]